MRPSLHGNPFIDQVADEFDIYGEPIVVVLAIHERREMYDRQLDGEAGVFAVFDSVVIFRSGYERKTFARRRNICDVSTRRLFGRQQFELEFTFQASDSSWNNVRFLFSKKLEETVRGCLPNITKAQMLQNRASLLQSALTELGSVPGVVWRGRQEFSRAIFSLNEIASSKLIATIGTESIVIDVENLYGVREISEPDAVGPLSDAQIGSLPEKLAQMFDFEKTSIYQLFFNDADMLGVIYLIAERSDLRVLALIDFFMLRDEVMEIYPLPRIPNPDDLAAQQMHVTQALKYGNSRSRKEISKWAPSGDSSSIRARAMSVRHGFQSNGRDYFYSDLMVLTETHLWLIPHVWYQTDVDVSGDHLAYMASFVIDEIVDCHWYVSHSGWQTLRILGPSPGSGEGNSVSECQFWGDPAGRVIARTLIPKVRELQKQEGRSENRFLNPSDDADLFQD